MNIECDDDKWTCEHCGERHYPEVGMSFCGCLGSYTGNRFDSDQTPASKYSSDTWESRHSEVFYEAPKREWSKKIRCTHYQAQTSKAWLFGFYPADGSINPVLIWVPKSCTQILEENLCIRIKHSFYVQYMKHRIRRKRPADPVDPVAGVALK